MADPINALQIGLWAIEHLHIPAIIWGIWKASRIFTKLEAVALKTIDQIDVMSTNHFPHMEASLKNQDGLMQSMDTSLKTIATHTPKVKIVKVKVPMVKNRKK